MRSRTRTCCAALAVLLAAAPAGARENSSELYRTGAQLAMQGKLDESIAVFRKVVEISPYYCMGYYGLGKACLYRGGMLDEAIRNLQAAVRLDRRLVRGHFYLGLAYFMARRYMDAAFSFKTAYGYDDTTIEALYNLGVVYEIIEKDYYSKLYFRRYLDAKLKAEEDIPF